MIKIIQERKLHESIEYALDYRWNDDKNAGFSFPCDKYGNILPFEHESAKENYEKCISGEFAVTLFGVLTFHHKYVEPAIGKCKCGSEVYLEDYFENACRCGRLYGLDGGELRQNWRKELYEETGELI